MLEEHHHCLLSSTILFTVFQETNNALSIAGLACSKEIQGALSYPYIDECKNIATT